MKQKFGRLGFAPGIVGLAVSLLFSLANPWLPAADLSVALPLQRAVYQDNEWIDVTVVRPPGARLNAGELELTLVGEDGSELNFRFPVPAAGLPNGSTTAVEHLRLNGRLLRPGKYLVKAACAGASARQIIEIFSHVRRSDFITINWGRATGKDLLPQGELNLGFNLFYGQSPPDKDAMSIRAGLDFAACCVMSGGHQMDLRQDCDWSDPYVIRGGTRRAVQRAFMDRTRPNVPGVHFYDEPGLTWSKDPATGEMSPHVVLSQWRSYEAAGYLPIAWREMDAANAVQAARWLHWAKWKLGFMDAAWQDAQFGVSSVKPDFLSLTQSQYGYGAFVDGYYFNVARSLPVTSGHGGYHDFGPGFFNPIMFLEFARARDYGKPVWYLPTWYGNTTPDEFRLEQFLSFQGNVQGLISPPDLDPAHPEKSLAVQSIVGANHLFARLGTIFSAMPVTRPPVALHFSLSQMIHDQSHERRANYAHETAHGRNLLFPWLAGKWLQHQFMPLLDEDILDGTLAAHHRAIILTSLDYLDPPIISALEDFAKQGGLVLLTADCTVSVRGAQRIGIAPAWPQAAQVEALRQAGKFTELRDLTTLRDALKGAQTLSAAIRPLLEKAGIYPPMASTEPGIVVTRQAEGDVEYLFAVNAAHDETGNPNLGIKPVAVQLSLVHDGRPVYDAMHGGVEHEFAAQGGRLVADYRFGPGQMRVFARTLRPIGGIQIATPVMRRDFSVPEHPISLELNALVTDIRPVVLNGPIPLRVVVKDALGAVRYDLYRATRKGALNLTLPLGVNEPAGTWQVIITELLNLSRAEAGFTVPGTRSCASAAGAQWRAVFWPGDRRHIFQFFRQQSRITLVPGTNAWQKAAAERLEKILLPWNVRCVQLSAAEAGQPRSLSADEAATWIGLEYAGRGQIKPGRENSPVQAGFAVDGPVILLGTPEDHPLIKHLASRGFLPYPPDPAAMPGPGRGYVAWQREGIGVNQESVTLIAYDAAGMEEAVGSLYEMAAGLEPLTPLAMPRENHIFPAGVSSALPEPAAQWTQVLNDSVDGLKVEPDKISLLAHDGTYYELALNGRVLSSQVLEKTSFQQAQKEFRQPWTTTVPAGISQVLPPARLVKYLAKQDRYTAVACWGGGLHIFDGNRIIMEQQLAQDITGLAWAGPCLIVGDFDGRITSLKIN